MHRPLERQGVVPQTLPKDPERVEEVLGEVEEAGEQDWEELYR